MRGIISLLGVPLLSMDFLRHNSWTVEALPAKQNQSYPVSTGKTGKAAERRAAKKRRNAKRRG